MQKQNFAFDIKEVAEDGTFTGLLSVYGNVDRGADVVEPGAFTKTIAANNGTVPMLWQHDRKEPIGLMEIRDTPIGLQVKGIFDLDVQRAREAYSLTKKRIVKGLSIGYNTVKDSVQGVVRHLQELELMEGSVVTFPMNPLAVITTVKEETLLMSTVEMLEDKPAAAVNGEAKEGRRISAASRKIITDAIGMHDEMVVMHGKAKGILQMMLDAEDEKAEVAFTPTVLDAFKTEVVLAMTAQ